MHQQLIGIWHSQLVTQTQLKAATVETKLYQSMFIHSIKEGVPEQIVNDSEVTSCVGFPSGSFICILKLRDLFSYILVEFSGIDLKKMFKAKLNIFGNSFGK